MSAVLEARGVRSSPSIRPSVVLLGAVGAGLGALAGSVELLAGPTIRDWVGNKQDTTRLGLVTLVLSVVALTAALELGRRPGAAAPRRFLLALGLLLPGLVCFTTVGRLWYLPGVLLVASGACVVAGAWGERRAVALAAERRWAAILLAVLALVYVFLGVTALGVAGALGAAGGLVVLALIAMRGRIAIPLARVLLIVAAIPFAAMTWWSAVTPLVGVLLLVLGVPGLAGRYRGRVAG